MGGEGEAEGPGGRRGRGWSKLPLSDFPVGKSANVSTSRQYSQHSIIYEFHKNTKLYGGATAENTRTYSA